MFNISDFHYTFLRTEALRKETEGYCNILNQLTEAQQKAVRAYAESAFASGSEAGFDEGKGECSCSN